MAPGVDYEIAWASFQYLAGLMVFELVSLNNRRNRGERRQAKRWNTGPYFLCLESTNSLSDGCQKNSGFHLPPDAAAFLLSGPQCERFVSVLC